LRLVVTSEFEPFFTASVAASAALIGLLFVSVSVAPERIFGPEADPRRQAQAISAFSALANVFFISMSSLIPGVLIGVVVTIIAGASTLQLLGLLARVRTLGLATARNYRANLITALRGGILFVVSAIVYGTELYLGLLLWTRPSTGALIGLLEVLLGAYAIGLGRAWQLLGAPRLGLVNYLLDFLERRLPPRPRT
jgi:hypothetical protein